MAGAYNHAALPGQMRITRLVQGPQLHAGADPGGGAIGAIAP